MKRKNTINLLLAVSLVTISNATAQDAMKKVSRNEIVVTAGRVSEKKTEVTANIKVLDREIIASSSAVNLGELLAENSIGHIHQYPGTLSAVGIRGFRTESHGNDLKGRVLILMNGRRAGTGNSAKLLTRNVERIEIVRGPAAVQYGSAGIGGVVNIVTRQGKGDPTASIEATYGSYDFMQGSFLVSGEANHIDFSCAYTHQERGEYNTGDGDKYRNTEYEQDAVSANIGYSPSPEHRIGLIVNHFESEAGSPSYLVQNDLDNFNTKKNSSFDLSYSGEMDDYSWQVRYFVAEDEDEWNDPSVNNPSGWDNDTPWGRTVDQQGAQVRASANTDLYRISAGIDWVKYDVEADSAPKETSYDNPAVYVLGKLRLIDSRLIASGGLRYDNYTLKVIDPTETEESDDNLSPHFGIAYMATESVKLRVNYGEGFMMPSADELAADYTSGGHRALGNPNLKPEASKTTDLGVDVNAGPFQGSITVFNTDYKDKIEDATTATADSTWENRGEANIQGFEADASYDIGEAMDWKRELKPYASLVLHTNYEDEETEEDLQYISDVQATFGLRYSNNRNTTANLNVTHTGEQKMTDYTAAFPYPEIEHDAFTVANLAVTRKIFDKKDGGALSLKGEIRNLLDEDYAYVNGYPMPGRSLAIGAKYDF